MKIPQLSLLALVTTVIACAPTQKLSTSVASDVPKPVANAPFVPAASQTIAAQVIRATPAFATARGASAACVAVAGAVSAVRFEAGRLLIRFANVATQSDCVSKVANSEAWVDAKAIEITDAAYAPALARVNEQPGLRFDMAYTGNKIFCDDKQACRINEALYANARCYAAPPVAEALARAARALAARDATTKLVILDCYRPIYVQERMFALVADPKWVAQPKPPRYGGHNRAVAIDVTLEKNGVALDMGTAFDAFDEKSEWHDDGRNLSAAQQSNRRQLRMLMIDSGFRPYDGEWWHFSLPIETPALNLPL